MRKILNQEEIEALLEICEDKPTDIALETKNFLIKIFDYIGSYEYTKAEQPELIIKEKLKYIIENAELLEKAIEDCEKTKKCNFNLFKSKVKETIMEFTDSEIVLTQQTKQTSIDQVYCIITNKRIIAADVHLIRFLRISIIEDIDLDEDVLSDEFKKTFEELVKIIIRDNKNCDEKIIGQICYFDSYQNINEIENIDIYKCSYENQKHINLGFIFQINYNKIN